MEEAVETLAELGLTNVQARAYITLTRLNRLTVSDISKLSGIPRTDLYRVIKDLQERGLVNRIIANPVRFEAAPMDDVLDLLLRKKNEQLLKLQKKAEKLKRVQNRKHEPDLKIETNSKFVLVSRNRIIPSIGEAIERAQERIDVILSQPRFSKGLIRFSDRIERSCNRGVKWRFLTEKPDGGKPFWNQIASLRAKPSCQVRFLTYYPETIAAIYDRKEVFIFETPAELITGSPALWSNNRSLISIVKDYFEVLWFTALEDEFQQTKD